MASVDLETRLNKLEKTEIVKIIKLLTSSYPIAAEKLQLILNEQDRKAQLELKKISQMSLASAAAFYQQEIPLVIKQAESMFAILEPPDDLDAYDYDPEDDPSEWNFDEGLAKMTRYSEYLLELVTPAQFISGTLGLLILINQLDTMASPMPKIRGPGAVDLYIG